ncbi:MAG: tetratricopeptide repeat protein [bacterium]
MRISKTKFYKNPLIIFSAIALLIGVVGLCQTQKLEFLLPIAIGFALFGYNVFLANKSTGEIRKDIANVDRKLDKLNRNIEKLQDKLEVSPPKSFEEIKAAIGKSPEEIGDAVLNKIRRGPEAFQQGLYAEAEGIYKTLTNLFPGVAHLHFNLGLAYHLQKKLPEAIKEYRIALGN